MYSIDLFGAAISVKEVESIDTHPLSNETRPAMMFNNVVFPLPLHPKEISKTISEKVLISSLIKITSPYENRNQYNSDITEGLKRYL